MNILLRALSRVLSPKERQRFLSMGAWTYASFNADLLKLRMKVRAASSRYQKLGETEMLASKTSDTVFVFGCGYSLNDITKEEWKHITSHDTVGFNGFVYEKWINVRYHLIKGWNEGSFGTAKVQAEEFMEVLSNNPLYDDTIFFIQDEHYAEFCNTLVGERYLPEGTKYYPYTTIRGEGPPTTALSEGLRFFSGTLSIALNTAICMQWKHIVLTGIDLYDNRYFWLAEDETIGVDYESGRRFPHKENDRGIRYDQTHSTVANGVVDLVGGWKDFLDERGIALSVYNPKSLLTQILPVYKSSQEDG